MFGGLFGLGRSEGGGEARGLRRDHAVKFEGAEPFIKSWESAVDDCNAPCSLNDT